MGALVTELVEIGRSPTPGEVEQMALVLAAVGIRCRVVAAEGDVLLLVPWPYAMRARRELAAYARENAAPPPARRTMRPIGRGVDAVLGGVAVLTFLFAADRRRAFSLDWATIGAAQAGLITDGQWWRTLTALGLHADLEHLVGNLLFGAAFALVASQVLGAGLAWLAIVAAGGVGNAINAVLQSADHAAIGASTAVFGTLGILSGHAWRTRVVPWRGGLRRWAPLGAGVMLLAFLGTDGERTDVGAHVLGFATGAAIGLALAQAGGRVPQGDRAQRVYGALACVLFALAWASALTAGR